MRPSSQHSGVPVPREDGMSNAAKRVTMHDAYEDLLRRTLSKISGDLGRLIYLASTRDYNTGTYHHEGLCVCYRGEDARMALRTAHRDVFCRLAVSSLEELVEQLEMYVQMSQEAPEEFHQAWEELEPYRIAIPMQVNSTMVQLFLSNVRLALKVLRLRQSQNPAGPSAASQLPSPVR
jgi:hypothetical protein